MQIPQSIGSVDNLRLAWRWIRSNPDRMYKTYCGEMYLRFALNDDANIKRLADRIQKGTYRPGHACKLLFPKSSGILRPYSILTVEDQIVYQAMINVVAEKIAPSARQFYNKTNFGHMYAGKTSVWFYRKWSDGYTAFNKAAKEAFKSGKDFSASFDLTACYDSLDHGVLTHFLKRLGLKANFTEPLARMLSTWTATQSRIYQNHGIPQGPLSSGLLSEAALNAFDHLKKAPGVEMLRYVDDIKLFAKAENELRRELTRLDMKSKDIGLFPQASKVDIHKVVSIDTELKQISSPVETVVTKGKIDQVGIRQRIMELTPRDRISNLTRFKYLLGSARPHSQLNAKLIRIAKARPDLVSNVMRYFRRYDELPASVGSALLQWLGEDILYPAVASELVETLHGRISGPQKLTLFSKLEKLWKPLTMDPSLMASAGRVLIEEGKLTNVRAGFAATNAKEWWVRCKLLSALNRRHYPEIQLEQICNISIRDSNSEVALAAAYRMIELDLNVVENQKPINGIAHSALALFGKAKGRVNSICGIELALHEFTGKATGVDWKKIFGADHHDVEQQALLTFPSAKVNASALVNGADVFHDWLVHALHEHEPSLGTYKLGNLTQASKATSKLIKLYPATHALISSVHGWRYSSPYSHPQEQKTKLPTKALPFRTIGLIRRLYRNAFHELAQQWPS